MLDLQIRVLGDPILRGKAKEVEIFDRELQQTLDEMLELMDEAEGVGLAAPQVGIPRCFFVAKLNDRVYRLINPIITYQEGLAVQEEGCLSIPNQYGLVERWEKISLSAQDEKGEAVQLEAEGLLARIFQHEIDHLHGSLIIDIMKEEEEEEEEEGEWE